MGGRHEAALGFRGAERYATLAEMCRIPSQQRVGGVIGGVGTLAHTDFERIVLDRNKIRDPRVSRDQDHPGLILVNGTGISDRTEALKLKEAGDDSAYIEVGDRILAAAQGFQREGAEFFTIICNTAHAWFIDLQDILPIPWVPIMGSAVQRIKEDYPEVKRVGILGTDGTMMAALYTDAVSAGGLVPVNLDLGSAQQSEVMAAIYNSVFGVKATGATVSDRARELLTKQADYLVNEMGAEIIIGGCTEIPPALKGRYNRVPFIDPLDALADVFLKLSMDRNARIPQLMAA